MKSPLLRTLAASAAVVSGGVLAACGTTVIDQGKAEKAIKDNLVKAGGQIKSVSCPKDVESKANKTFECAIISAKDGSTIHVTMHIKDSKGNVHFDQSDLHR